MGFGGGSTVGRPGGTRDTMENKKENGQMLIYCVKDHTGAETKHLAINKESAIQAHMIHFGLTGLKEKPKVDEGIKLSEFVMSRKEICWDSICSLVAATKVE